MIDYLKKLLSGYRMASRRVNGLELRYTFLDKPIFFDPIGMLKEFSQRSAEEGVQRLQVSLSFSELLSGFPSPIEKEKPSVICECSKNGNELRVSRFAMKDGIYPISLYQFEVNGELVGTFRRKYDYGSHIQLIGQQLAHLSHTDIVLNSEKWLWKNESGQQLFVEKFGHSQIWFFSNPGPLNNWN